MSDIREKLGEITFLGDNLGERVGDKKQTYTVGEAASMIGETTDTVQYWCKEFKTLIPYYKAANEYKTFDLKALEVLKQIQHMKKEGFSLKAIKATLSGVEASYNPKVAEMLQALTLENKALHTEIEQLREVVLATQIELRKYIESQQKLPAPEVPEVKKQWWKFW